jgi:Protein of unknown function (DUF3106)
MSRTILILVLIVGCLLPVGKVAAGDEPGVTNAAGTGTSLPDNMPPRLRDKLSKLPPAERQKLLDRWQQFRNLPPEARKMLGKNYQKFRNMSQEQQEQLKQRLQQWQNMSAEQKKQLQENFERWKKLSPQEREELRKRHGRRPAGDGESPASSP